MRLERQVGALVAALLLGAVLAASATASSAVRGTALAMPPSQAVPPVVSGGRIWWAEQPSSPDLQLVLHSRPLRSSGPDASVSLAVPPIVSPSIEGGPSVTSLAVAGRMAFVVVNQRVDDAQGYRMVSQLFTFEVATGRMLRAGPLDDSEDVRRLNPGALLVTYVRSPGSRFVMGRLTDPLTGASFPGTYRTSPGLAQFAGPYTVSTEYDERTSELIRATVTDYRTGSIRYRVSGTRLRQLAGGNAVAVRVGTLQPDGSLGIIAERADGAGPLQNGASAVYVDARGRVHRASRRLQSAQTVVTLPAGDRVVVASDGGAIGRGATRRRLCMGTWIVNSDGSRGTSLATERGAGRLRVAGAASFWDGRTGIWLYKTHGRDAERRYVVRQLGGVALGRAGRPSCERGLRDPVRAAPFSLAELEPGL